MALPVNGRTHLIPAYYSIYQPQKDERLSWPSWLTYSGWFAHISGHPSAAGRAQDRESSPARDRRSTSVPRHQLRNKDSDKYLVLQVCFACREFMFYAQPDTTEVTWETFFQPNSRFDTEEIKASNTHTHTHTRLTALCLGLPR